MVCVALGFQGLLTPGRWQRIGLSLGRRLHSFFLADPTRVRH
jgi:hypothetical protein